MSGPPAVVTSGLTKSYGRHRGVIDVDLEVRAGEVFGFLGPNGAGKSTVIHLLVGLLRPTGGHARVLGVDAWAEREAVQRRLGFLPGELALYERLTGAQMLDHLAALRGGVDPTAVAGLTERFQVELDRPIHQLSMGNKQKIGLVQAFMHDPELLVLDEPTLGLDPLVQQQFHALIADRQAAGRTVFLSSHRLSEVERIADRVGIIREGRLVDILDVHALASLAVRRLDLQLARPADPAPFAALAGVRRAEAEAGGHHLHLEVEGSLAQVIRLAAEHDVVDLRVREADLEDVFLTYYRAGGQPAAEHRGEPDAEPGAEHRGEL